MTREWTTQLSPVPTWSKPSRNLTETRVLETKIKGCGTEELGLEREGKIRQVEG